MVGNINPREEDFEESVRALNYTAVAREVKTMRSRLGSIKFKSSKKIRLSSVVRFDKEKIFENDRNCSSSVIINKKISDKFVLKKDYLNLKKKMDFIIRQNTDLFKLTRKLFEKTFFEKIDSPKTEEDFKENKNKENFIINSVSESIQSKENKKKYIINKKKIEFNFESPKQKDFIKKNPTALLSVKARPLFSNHDEYQNFSSQKILKIISKKEEEEKKCQDFYIENFLKKKE